jgi:hypothetical protein
MLFLIFTTEGLAEAEPEVLQHKAGLWLNPALKKTSDLSVFEKAGIEIQPLPYEVDASDEKAVMSALTFVEKHSQDKAIFVEYL